jgi:glycine cleavage system H protein
MYPDDRKYTKEHEWIRLDGDTAVVGITVHAAEQLGDVTYVELAEVGAEVSQGDGTGAVESVKAASDIYAPVGGRVSEVNETLETHPERVNESPHDEGWFYKLEDVNAADLDALMDAAAYEAYMGTLDE